MHMLPTVDYEYICASIVQGLAIHIVNVLSTKHAAVQHVCTHILAITFKPFSILSQSNVVSAKLILTTMLSAVGAVFTCVPLLNVSAPITIVYLFHIYFPHALD